MTSRQNLIRGVGFLLVLALGAVLAPAARAGQPCCNITAVDKRTGVVTARDRSIGRTFQFKVSDAALLKSLKVGQKISADLKAMTVTLPAARPGAKPVQVGIHKLWAEPVGGKIHGAEPVGTKIHSGQPCCSITAVDKRTGMVTAKEIATGRTFQFKVANLKALGGLKVGQAVAADFRAGMVTVRPAGAQPVNGIILK